MEPLTIPSGKGKVLLMPAGIIHLLWRSGVSIEESDARAAMAAVNEAAQGGEYPLLVDMANTASVSREARGVFSIPCAATRIALLGTSPVDRVLANFFLRVHIPPCPTRFFTARQEALTWLLEPSVPG